MTGTVCSRKTDLGRDLGGGEGWSKDVVFMPELQNSFLPGHYKKATSVRGILARLLGPLSFLLAF